MPPSIEARVEEGLKQSADSLYLKYLNYFNIVGQVHSVVVSKLLTKILRIWCGQKLNLAEKRKAREAFMFRVKQENFKHYEAKPIEAVEEAVRRFGKEELIEIEVYDEYRNALDGLKSGDYVVLTNVHFAKSKTNDVFVMHGGGNKFNRAALKIPENLETERFLEFKKNIENLTPNPEKRDEVMEFEETWTAKETRQRNPENYSRFPKEKEKQQVSDNVPKMQKILLGDGLISVDCFPKLRRPKYCFLTHAHSDHTRGLDERWTHTIYCTQKTAIILPIVTAKSGKEGVSSNVCTFLEPGSTYTFDEFRVTVLDANHCQGAVMFLFEGRVFPCGPVLCTGDFRADSEFLTRFDIRPEYQKLKEAKLWRIYLDNTYMRVDSEFLERRESVAMLMDEIKKYPDRDLYLPMHKLGREQLLESLSEKLQEPITVYELKRKVLDALQFFVSYGMPRKRSIFVTDKTGFKFQGDPEKSAIFDITYMKIPEEGSRQRDAENSMLDFEGIVPISAPMPKEVSKYLLTLSKSKGSVADVVWELEPPAQTMPTSAQSESRSPIEEEEAEFRVSKSPEPKRRKVIKEEVTEMEKRRKFFEVVEQMRRRAVEAEKQKILEEEERRKVLEEQERRRRIEEIQKRRAEQEKDRELEKLEELVRKEKAKLEQMVEERRGREIRIKRELVEADQMEVEQGTSYGREQINSNTEREHTELGPMHEQEHGEELALRVATIEQLQEDRIELEHGPTSVELHQVRKFSKQEKEKLKQMELRKIAESKRQEMKEMYESVLKDRKTKKNVNKVHRSLESRTITLERDQLHSDRCNEQVELNQEQTNEEFGLRNPLAIEGVEIESEMRGVGEGTSTTEAWNQGMDADNDGDTLEVGHDIDGQQVSKEMEQEEDLIEEMEHISTIDRIMVDIRKIRTEIVDQNEHEEEMDVLDQQNELRSQDQVHKVQLSETEKLQNEENNELEQESRNYDVERHKLQTELEQRRKAMETLERVRLNELKARGVLRIQTRLLADQRSNEAEQMRKEQKKKTLKIREMWEEIQRRKGVLKDMEKKLEMMGGGGGEGPSTSMADIENTTIEESDGVGPSTCSMNEADEAINSPNEKIDWRKLKTMRQLEKIRKWRVTTEANRKRRKINETSEESEEDSSEEGAREREIRRKKLEKVRKWRATKEANRRRREQLAYSTQDDQSDEEDESRKKRKKTRLAKSGASRKEMEMSEDSDDYGEEDGPSNSTADDVIVEETQIELSRRAQTLIKLQKQREELRRAQEERERKQKEEEEERNSNKTAERMLKVECDNVEIVNELPQPTTREEALRWLFHVPEVRRKSLPSERKET